MPTAQQTFTDENAARQAMRALIRRGYNKAGVALRRPANGGAFTVSVDVDAADTAAARILEQAARGSPTVSQAREMVTANPVGALVAAFVAGYAARLLLR
ncbi:hypothetical protein [Alsobacter soli]|nr:hypothetical protein [Alsobacter soli]